MRGPIFALGAGVSRPFPLSRVTGVLLQHRRFYSFRPGRIAIQDSLDRFRILLKTKEELLVICMPLPP
jgi:hypothetical protein